MRVVAPRRATMAGLNNAHTVNDDDDDDNDDDDDDDDYNNNNSNNLNRSPPPGHRVIIMELITRPGCTELHRG